MANKILVIAMLTVLFLNSCKETPTQESAENTTSETFKNGVDDIVTSTFTDKDGKKLELTFNNTKGTATLSLNGETIELVAQKSASGIWYKNENYELRGKGNDIQLTKDGNVIFEHQDDKVNVEAKNNLGDVLNMTFNNTEGTVKAYLNGGEQIDLVEKKAASGIWYKNDHYELSGKGDNYTLKKDGKTVFKN
ncbi:MAG: MliC family protein [Bacteroidetes bacterium]|nr:MliC family protein [Bacteroidota bacterium]MBK8487143.1 MliC family protein [Bacteroidota bacterium]